MAAIMPDPGFAAPLPLDVYGRLPGLEMASISPSGDHVAVLASVGDARQVLVLGADRKVTNRFPVDPKSKVRNLMWAGDQSVLIETSHTVRLETFDFTTDKAELSSVFVVPLDGTKPWAVFAGTDTVTGGVHGNYGVVQRNGQWFGYFGTVTTIVDSGGPRRLPTDSLNPDLYEVDLQNHRFHRIAYKASGADDSRDWLIDDKGAVGAVLNLGGTSGTWTLSNAQSQKLASGMDKAGDVTLIGFTTDGSGVIYSARDAQSGDNRWFSVPLAGGTPQPMLDDMDIDRAILDADHRLIGYVERNANHDSHFFDPRQDKIYKSVVHAYPKSRVVLDAADRAFDRLLVTTEGEGDPETWYLVDLKGHHADPVGYSYVVASDDVGPIRMVSYTAADGLKMEGVLTLPSDRPAKALPAIMLPHGGPAAHDEIRFDWIAQAFASRGYAVFQPNFRGSTGYGAAFRKAGNGEWGRKMQTDISDGLAELVRQGVVDPHRVSIVGASYGGYAALAGVTLQHGIYRCAVADAGIGNVENMVKVDIKQSNEDPMLVRYLAETMGGRDLRAMSPVHFADKVDVPVLLIHGKDDTVVPYSQSADMLDALRHAGKPVELVTLKQEDHWLSRSETRLQMLQASVDFVMKHNPPDPAPSGPIATKVP
ncbi:prolyl oligopeptidase family serine peptidase [Novosphingobium sp.]|uniref:alpha/beta hydrolase family protein n=1 Tax=Novosphingobium sp. TaxID=1874826 RepID=UPI003D0E5E4F